MVYFRIDVSSLTTNLFSVFNSFSRDKMVSTTFVISLALIISGTVMRTLGSSMKEDYPEEHSKEYPSGEVKE